MSEQHSNYSLQDALNGNVAKTATSERHSPHPILALLGRGGAGPEAAARGGKCCRGYPSLPPDSLCAPGPAHALGAVARQLRVRSQSRLTRLSLPYSFGPFSGFVLHFRLPRPQVGSRVSSGWVLGDPAASAGLDCQLTGICASRVVCLAPAAQTARAARAAHRRHTTLSGEATAPGRQCTYALIPIRPR